MAEVMHGLEISQADQEAFILCLALGTLEAMRSGAWPLDAGIWTLGRPAFWQPLVEAGSDVAEVLQAADELSALEKLKGRSAAEELLGSMIAGIRSRLSALPEKSWYARWKDGADA